MPFISITRLRLRAWRFLPRFFLLTMGTRRQVQQSPGYRGGSLLADRRSTFWTMTAWDTEADMRAYTTSGAHRAAMPRLVEWCDEASVTHWEQPDEQLPSWTLAEDRMRREGRPSKVRHPSANHASLAFDPARTTRAVAIPVHRGTP